MKHKIILGFIVLSALFLCTFNPGELSGGDDSQYAELASHIVNGRANPFYVVAPDVPSSWGNNVYIRPVGVMPFTLSVWLFGNTLFASRLPTLLFSLASIIVFYLILKRYYNTGTVLLACYFLAVNPFTLAFARMGILNASLLFYLLLIFLFIFKGFEEKPYFFYLAGFFVLLNQLTSQFRGLLPIVGILPYLYYRFKEGQRRQFIHLAIAMILPIIFAHIMGRLPFRQPAWHNANQGHWPDHSAIAELDARCIPLQ